MSSFKRLRHRILPPSGDMVSRRFEGVHSEIKTLHTALQALQGEIQNVRNDLQPAVTLPLIQGHQAAMVSMLRLLEPRAVTSHPKARFGSPHDGGYVQLDDFAGYSHALSFGIFDNDSWDLAVAKRGIPVEQFDHTVDQAPSRHELLHFHKTRISAKEGQDSETLEGLIERYSQKNTPDILLKIDIDGDEWDVFDATPQDSLRKCAQIVCEFHFLRRFIEPGYGSRAHRVLEKLARDFAVIHVHGNNGSNWVNVANVTVPDVIEISYVNRSLYQTVESRETFPTALDTPNIPEVPDQLLGTFHF